MSPGGESGLVDVCVSCPSLLMGPTVPPPCPTVPPPPPPQPRVGRITLSSASSSSSSSSSDCMRVKKKKKTRMYYTPHQLSRVAVESGTRCMPDDVSGFVSSQCCVIELLLSLYQRMHARDEMEYSLPPPPAPPPLPRALLLMLFVVVRRASLRSMKSEFDALLFIPRQGERRMDTHHATPHTRTMTHTWTTHRIAAREREKRERDGGTQERALLALTQIA